MSSLIILLVRLAFTALQLAIRLALTLLVVALRLAVLVGGALWRAYRSRRRRPAPITTEARRPPPFAPPAARIQTAVRAAPLLNADAPASDRHASRDDPAPRPLRPRPRR